MRRTLLISNMTNLSQDQKLERPPTYASIDAASRSSHCYDPHCEPREASNHELEVHTCYGNSSLDITEKGNTLYHLSHYQKLDTPDMILYAGYDNRGPQLALASFIPYSKDLKTYVGGLKTPTFDDWDVARCAGGGMFKNPCYRFETRSDDDSGKAKYYWQKTSDRRLGASRWSPRDYKLVRERDDEVVAVYAEHHLGSASLKGTIRFRQKMGEYGEMASMMVLLSLLEMSRRYMKTVARAFPLVNSY